MEVDPVLPGLEVKPGDMVTDIPPSDAFADEVILIVPLVVKLLIAARVK